MRACMAGYEKLFKVAHALACCGDRNDTKRKHAVKALEELYQKNPVSGTYLFAARFLNTQKILHAFYLSLKLTPIVLGSQTGACLFFH